MSQKTVVILGNGVAGSQLAANLNKQKRHKVVMVTPFDYMEISVNMTKVVAAGPDEHNHALHPLMKEGAVEYKLGYCKELKENQLVMNSGETVNFDVCVVCTGDNIAMFYPNPATDGLITDRKTAMEKVYEDIVKAEKIVIGGGGPVGAEAAADIKLRNPTKSVTIVTRASQVLSKMSPGFPEAAAKALSDMGVDVVCGETVASHAGDQVICASGKTIPCDYYLESFSKGANTSFMPPACLADKGYVKVDRTFKVEGMNSVFAFGDCANIIHAKNFPQIEDQLPTMTFNVSACLEDKPLKMYKPGTFSKFTGPALVALGHGHPGGVGLGPDIPMCGCNSFCWFCCCCGNPCSTPASHGIAKIKADFNKTVVPKKGMGIHR